MRMFVLLIMSAFASEQKETDAESVSKIERTDENAPQIFVKIEEDEHINKNVKFSSNYIGVSYNNEKGRWQVQRWNKNEKKIMYYGRYEDEETAAHASDTLARKLMANGEQNLNLNFPNGHIEVYPEEKKSSSKYIGVTYQHAKWRSQRWSKNEKTMVFNGSFKDEETAAHASDTLARKLMANGDYNLKINFPDDHIEVRTEQRYRSYKYIGVTYNKRDANWRVQRWSKIMKKMFPNGYYKGEETAAHASDTLARKLIANGEQNLKLNFPYDSTEEHQRFKRKRSDHEDFGHLQNE